MRIRLFLAEVPEDKRREVDKFLRDISRGTRSLVLERTSAYTLKRDEITLSIADSADYEVCLLQLRKLNDIIGRPMTIEFF